MLLLYGRTQEPKDTRHQRDRGAHARAAHGGSKRHWRDQRVQRRDREGHETRDTKRTGGNNGNGGIGAGRKARGIQNVTGDGAAIFPHVFTI
jgi:hypothetical protein